MADAGRIDIELDWDGEEVRAVGVHSTRPRASWLLAGRTPEHVLQLVPLLFSVCGKAQQACASAALGAARGQDAPEGIEADRRIACEAMQEHLWRLLLDWPDALELPQQQQQFVRWHAALNEIAAGQGDMEKLHGELYRVLLGVDEAEWRKIDSHARLEAWWNAGHGSLASVLAALDLREAGLEFVGDSAHCDFLPEWSAAEAQQALGERLDRDFAVHPEYDGRPLETGALSHFRRVPLLRDILRLHPNRLLARLLARLLDLLDSIDALRHGRATQRVQAVADGDGTGLALVRTARGTLLHRARIEAGKVADYLIVAPTEWNFHPHGALASGLVELRESDAQRLEQTARCFVLSLDPCVEYAIEVKHA